MREASKRPGIEVVAERMEVEPQFVVSTLAQAARHLDSEFNNVSRPESDPALHIVPDGQSREMKHECALCHRR